MDFVPRILNGREDIETLFFKEQMDCLLKKKTRIAIRINF